MNILYDHQVFTWQKYGGISRYFCELFRNFPSSDVNIRHTAIFSENVYLQDYGSNIKSIFPDKKIKGKIRIYGYYNKINSILSLKHQDYDILHPTYYDPYFVKYAGRKPVVITVHDMTHELFPELFSNKDKSSFYKKECVKRADKIIAISNHTKRDLVNLLDVNPDKIEIIYHGISPSIDFQMPEGRITERPFILFVGDREGYKNFEIFFKAFVILKKSFPDLTLICTGKPFTKDEKELFSAENLNKDIVHISASDKQMAKLFNDAELFVYPSQNEGFGLPILEAFKFGCPTVISDIECFHEVSGNASVYFDPFDIDSIVDNVNRVILNNDLKKSLQKKGTERMQLFTWQNTAIKTYELYNKLL